MDRRTYCRLRARNMIGQVAYYHFLNHPERRMSISPKIFINAIQEYRRQVVDFAEAMLLYYDIEFQVQIIENEFGQVIVK